MELTSFIYESQSDSEDNFVHPSSQNIEKLNTFSQGTDDEDEKNYPCVYYQLPYKEDHTHAQEAAIRAAKLEKIKLKKQEESEVQQKLIITSDRLFPSLTIKNITRLTKPREEVQSCCYIPERDLLLTILRDKKTVKIYNTLTFKLIAAKIFKISLSVVTFIKDYEKIYFGGEQYYLEACSAYTLETDEIAKPNGRMTIEMIVQLKKHNALAIKGSWARVDILSASLTLIFAINIGDHEPYRKPKEILCLHKNYLLVVNEPYYSDTCTKSHISLYNFKSRKLVDTPKLNLCPLSMVAMTKKKPFNVVTCLVSLSCEENDKSVGHKLFQLKLDTKTEKLVVHKMGPEDMLFQRLCQLRNSDYFAAKPVKGNVCEAHVIMKITEEGRIQMINLILDPNSSINHFYLFHMMKEQLISVGIDAQNSLCLYNVSTKEDGHC